LNERLAAVFAPGIENEPLLMMFSVNIKQTIAQEIKETAGINLDIMKVSI
jgi:hypothetical protein